MVDYVEQQLGIGKTILLGQVGSKAYGTNTPTSDDDFMGIVVPPMSYYTGLDHHPDNTELKEFQDSGHIELFDFSEDQKKREYNFFELRKFLRLATNFNPNIIPLLYLRKEDYVVRSNLGGLLITMRKAFVSKKAYKTLIGYAVSQRKAVVNGDTGKLGMKRKELVARYGYDTKYASHTIRILRMGIEFFQSNGENLNVFREIDAPELLQIREGQFSLDSWVDMVDFELDRARELEKLNVLPEEPKYAHISKLSNFIISKAAAYADH